MSDNPWTWMWLKEKYDYLAIKAGEKNRGEISEDSYLGYINDIADDWIWRMYPYQYDMKFYIADIRIRMGIHGIGIHVMGFKRGTEDDEDESLFRI